MSADGLVWLCTDDRTLPDVEAIDQGLDAFNRALPALAQVRFLCCSVRLASGGCIGGAVARSWGEVCELRQLWVDERWRRGGLGSGLVGRVEAEARARDCRLVQLDTFSFQAPEFYRRLGYTTVWTVAGFPDGIERHYLVKRLA